MNEKITAKEVRMRLHNGMGTEYFLERLAIPTPQELMEYMERYHAPMVKDFKKLVKSNDKVLARKRSLDKSEEATTYVVADEMEDDEEGSKKVDEKTEGEEKVLEDVIDEMETSEEHLAKLLQDEEEASNRLIQLESQHKEIVLRRHSHVEKLRENQAELQKLYEELSNKRYRVRELLAGYETLGTKMHEAANEVASQKEKLEAIRTEIECLKEIQVFVYANGQIEFENEDFAPIKLNKEREKEMFSELLSKPESEDLTLKALRAIPRLVETMSYFSDRKVTVVFEQPQMETLYNSLLVG